MEDKFKNFNLSKNLQRAIKNLGYEEPTQIQEESIPFVLEGKDVVGESATGSGKTLAFGCGAIETTTPKKGVQVLILLPTRELAEQVTKSIKELDLKNELKILSVYGGVSINHQIDALRYSEIVVATPGRLRDHMERGTIDLSRINLLILDEADRMLDMGFIEDIEYIVKRCPEKRQTLFFSATFPPQVTELSKKYLKNPERVKVRNQVDPKLLRQVYYDVRRGEKLSLLVHLIKQESSDKIMIFCNTRINTDLIQKNLERNQVKSSALHGGLTQATRTKIIENFKKGRTKILVCTDVAARGIHVDDVTHVYNYDIPKDANDYVHRIGRTARAGNDGLVINVLADMDHDNFSRILQNYDFNIEKKEKPEMKRLKFEAPRRNQGRGFGNRGPRNNQQRNQRSNERHRGPRNQGPRNQSRGFGNRAPRNNTRRQS